MDVFEIGHQFGEFDFQLHDHNPGVSESGIFWTMPIPGDSVTTRLGAGEAAFCLSDAQMPDSHDLLTALWGGGELDGEGNPLPGSVFASTVSMDARWFDGGRWEILKDKDQQFKYVHKRTNARVKWRAVRRGAAYESNEEDQEVLFAAVGFERNGEFF